MKLKSLLEGIRTSSGSEVLDGKSPTNAKNWILNKLNPVIRGTFSDKYWRPVNEIWKWLDRHEINYIRTGTKYEHEVVRLADGSNASLPMRKFWTFEVKYFDNRQNLRTMYGRIVAAGAGPNDDPLKSYDVTLTF